MFFTKDEDTRPRECSTCCYWNREGAWLPGGNDEYEIDGFYCHLGHCKRYPPSRVVQTTAISKREQEYYDRRCKEAEEKLKEWESCQAKRRDGIQEKIDRAKESLRTAAHPDSAKHWTDEIEKLEQKFQNNLMQVFEIQPYQSILDNDEPPKGKDICLGAWPRTKSEDLCGEWRSSWPEN